MDFQFLFFMRDFYQHVLISLPSFPLNREKKMIELKTPSPPLAIVNLLKSDIEAEGCQHWNRTPKIVRGGRDRINLNVIIRVGWVLSPLSTPYNSVIHFSSRSFQKPVYSALFSSTPSSGPSSTTFTWRCASAHAACNSRSPNCAFPRSLPTYYIPPSYQSHLYSEGVERCWEMP